MAEEEITKRLGKYRWMLQLQPFIINKICGMCLSEEGGSCISKISTSCYLLKDSCMLGLPSVVSNKDPQTGKTIIDMNKLRCANPGSAFIGATMALAVDRGLNALLLNRELNNLDGVGSHEIADFCDLMVIATSSFCSSISSHIWIATDMAKLLYGADEDKINSYINSSDRTLTGSLPLNDEIMQSVSSSYKRELREKIWNKNNLLLNEKNISLRAKQLLEAVIELGFAMAGLRDLFTMCQEIIIKDNDNDEYYALKKRDINFIDTSLVVAERAFNQLKAVLKPIALQLISVAEYKCDNWRDIAEENGWDTMCRTGSLTLETAKKRLAGETELAQGPLLNEALDYLWASAYPKEDHVEP